jgi:hypothetical protein
MKNWNHLKIISSDSSFGLFYFSNKMYGKRLWWPGAVALKKVTYLPPFWVTLAGVIVARIIAKSVLHLRNWYFILLWVRDIIVGFAWWTDWALAAGSWSTRGRPSGELGWTSSDQLFGPGSAGISPESYKSNGLAGSSPLCYRWKGFFFWRHDYLSILVRFAVRFAKGGQPMPWLNCCHS